MEPYIIALCIVVAVVLISILLIKRTQNDERQDKNALITKRSKYEMAISFSDLPALTEQEETKLVEVRDSKLLSRIDNAIPGTLQTIANTGAVKTYSDAAKSTGQLYQAIIPKGAVLDKSRTMEGAVRGSFRNAPNSIKGNANWVAVDNKAANNLATVSSVNAAMSVASMVVGQYYMSQISEQLEDINAGIEKIADFQQNEFKSKVYALVAEIQKSSTFQVCKFRPTGVSLSLETV